MLQIPAQQFSTRGQISPAVQQHTPGGNVGEVNNMHGMITPRILRMPVDPLLQKKMVKPINKVHPCQSPRVSGVCTRKGG